MNPFAILYSGGLQAIAGPLLPVATATTGSETRFHFVYHHAGAPVRVERATIHFGADNIKLMDLTASVLVSGDSLFFDFILEGAP